MSKRIRIYSDGGSKHNGMPNQWGYGSYRIEGELPVRLDFGNCTSNVAEYKSFIAALSHVKKYDLKDVESIIDSSLIIGQVTLGWKCKTRHLEPLVDEAKLLVEQTGVTIRKAPRDILVAMLGH